MSRALGRLWRWLKARPIRPHVLPLVVLSVVHVAVFERGLRGRDGLPVAVIPYDFLDSYFRFFVYISDTLRAGALPTWFPYGHAGSPFFMYPQSQLWSPITWIVSLTTGYSLLVVQWQQWMTLLIGSMGVYAWAQTLWGRRSASLVAALAYNFTSARLCNAQHMDIVTAFSLFPWVFVSLQWIARGSKPSRVLLAASLALLVVSGYSGVVLLSPLWFGAWASWLLKTECDGWRARRRYAADVMLSIGLGAVMSAAFWLPIAIHGGAFTRGDPLPTHAALQQSLAPSDLWHLIFGAGISLPPVGAVADMSMRGLYFGIIPLALALLAVMVRHERAVSALGIGFVAALLMSLGSHFFGRVALHDLVRPLNLSRFPSGDSRAVAALAGSLLAGAGLSSLLEGSRRRLLAILAGLAGVLVVGLIWLPGVAYPGIAQEKVGPLFTNVVVLELFVVVVGLLAVARSFRPRTLAIALVALVAVDAGTHASADAPMFARHQSDPMVGRAQQVGALHVKAFDPGNALRPRADSASLTDRGSSDAYLTKTFYLPSYCTFQLKRLDVLLAAGFRPFLVNGKRVVGFSGVPPEDGPTFERTAAAVDFEIKEYLPDRVEYTVTVPQRTTLVFNEVFFPGWRASIDGRPAVPVHEVSRGLRAIVVDPGRHVVSTWFRPPIFWVGLVSTAVGWIAAFVWLLVGRRKEHGRPPATADSTP